MIDAELLKAREKAVKGDSGDGGRSDSEGVKGGKPYVRPWDRGKGTCYEHYIYTENVCIMLLLSNLFCGNQTCLNGTTHFKF